MDRVMGPGITGCWEHLFMAIPGGVELGELNSDYRVLEAHPGAILLHCLPSP